MQVRLAALKREEDALHRERETLEAAKVAHIKCAELGTSVGALGCRNENPTCSAKSAEPRSCPLASAACMHTDCNILGILSAVLW